MKVGRKVVMLKETTKLLVFPLNLLNNHWVFVVTKLETCQLVCYDSLVGLPEYTREADHILKHLGNALTFPIAQDSRSNGQFFILYVSTLAFSEHLLIFWVALRSTEQQP